MLGIERQLRGDAAILRRRAEQVLEMHVAVERLPVRPSRRATSVEKPAFMRRRSGWKSRTCTVVEPIRSESYWLRTIDSESVYVPVGELSFVGVQDLAEAGRARRDKSRGARRCRADP